MRLKNLLVSVAIVELVLLASTSDPPALASGGGYQTSTPNDSTTLEGVVLPDNSQQSANIQIQPRPPWGVPYWSNGNICRDQGVDIVCLTPQEANKLRWLIPSKFESPYQNTKTVR